jgi:hypothetical protein
MWFNLAAAQGNETAAGNYDIVAGLMAPADISEAQRLARAWLEAIRLAPVATVPLALTLPAYGRTSRRASTPMSVDELHEASDMAGRATWWRILRAIDELCGTAPGRGRACSEGAACIETNRNETLPRTLPNGLPIGRQTPTELK